MPESRPGKAPEATAYGKPRYKAYKDNDSYDTYRVVDTERNVVVAEIRLLGYTSYDTDKIARSFLSQLAQVTEEPF